MASGKSNYFRHHFRAHEDENILILIEHFGVHGYYAYFVLLERCAELLADGKEFPLVFHESSLRKSLKLSKKKLRSFLEVSEKFLGISSEVSEKLIRISCPKLLKYVGFYFKNAPKESKVKESKVNKSKIKNKSEENSFETFDNFKNNFEVAESFTIDIFKLWNENCGTLPKAQTLTPKRITQIKNQIKIYPHLDHWAKVIEKFKASDFCLNTWRPNFDDFLSETKRASALENRYENKSENNSKNPYLQTNEQMRDTRERLRIERERSK